MKLHYRKLGQGQPLLILHGLFGSSDNWQTLGKKFAEHFEVWLIDQRNHGHSPHSDEFDYWAMADDLEELIDENEIEDAILLGHSMGGKTVMTLAQQHPEHIAKLVVADIGPKAYSMHHDLILEGLNALDLSKIKSRGQADKEIQKFIPEPSTRQFLLKNLYWEQPGQLEWRINLSVLTREIHTIIEGLPSNIVDIPTLFIRGDQSNYILDEDLPNILNIFPNAEFHTINGAGHWLHAESPEEFYSTVLKYCLND